MFDKLIESNSEEAEFKPRRKFFMVSSVVVGILFLSAVVFSLYAQDIDLGTDNFELVEMLAPVAADAPQPEPPREQPHESNPTQQRNDIAIRHDLIARIDDNQATPDKISTIRFTGMTRPDGLVKIDPLGAESNAYNPSTNSDNPNGSSAGAETRAVAETEKLPEPPPAAVKTAPKKLVISDGVINGKATYLPPPPYPAPAKMVGAYGVVNVQVTIDESGKVISSKAVTGHALLRQSAEAAAWKAKFSPTLLSKVPVKVTGVIMYNFKKS